ncbi:MAG: hypothetical protein AAF649_02850 [Verrucomicrobiota bacterium]
MEIPTWMSELLILAGLLVLAIACFRARNLWVRRTGVWIIFSMIGLAIWFWTGLWYLVALALASWFIIPVMQAALTARKLRFSLKRKLTPGPLDPDEFPEIHPVSSELRDLGFLRDSDQWLKPSPLDQGFRIFHHAEDNISSALAVVRQGAVSLSYLIFATKDQDGAYWITWDYPLAYGLKMPPHFKVHRCLEAETVSELHDQHCEFLRINEVSVTTRNASLSDAGQCFDQLFQDTMQHNLSVGVLHQEPDNQEEIRYSWRGTFFIAWQVLVEVVRG